MCKKILKRLNYKRIISQVLLFAMLFSMAISHPLVGDIEADASIESELAEKQSQLKKLENALAQAKKEKAEIFSKIEESESRLQALVSEKSKLEVSIEYTENEILLIEQLILGYEEQLAAFEENLNTTRDLKEKKIAELCSVLQYIYENKDVSSLELFFSSDSFSEYLSKREQAQGIASYQETLISEMKKVEKETEQAQADYEKAMVSLEGYKTLMNENIASVSEEYVKLENVIVQLQEEKELTEEEYNAMDAIEKEYAAEIGQVKIDIEELSEYLSKQFRWPFYESQSYRITSYFGNRTDPFLGYTKYHNGMDLAVPYGTPILACAGGVVTRSEYAPVFGNVVVITHADGLQTLYCHCSKLLVTVGTRVKQGDVIAKVGSTGRSTGNHLHLSFILNGSYVDPEKYLPSKYFN